MRLLPITCLALACAGAPPSTTPNAVRAPSTRGFSQAVRDGLARVRATTQRFQNLDSAVAAGYTREVKRCYVDSMPGAMHGAMGFHHLNRAFVDDRVEVDHPEILLYERMPDGRYALNGVEFIVPYSRWSREAVPPTVFGLDLKRGDNLNLWYLHMWAWKENPEGLFADWNPAVHCPPPGS